LDGKNRKDVKKINIRISGTGQIDGPKCFRINIATEKNKTDWSLRWSKFFNPKKFEDV